MKPTIDVAVEISYHLGVSLDKLFGFADPGKVSIFGLNENQKDIVVQLISLFQNSANNSIEMLTDEQNKIVGKIVTSFIINNKKK